MLMTRGFLNLTHRNGHELPEALEPGTHYAVTVPFKAVGQTIAAGNRIRLALSPTYWPYAWPSPVAATLTISLGGESFLDLPVRSSRAGEGEPAPFLEPEISAPLESYQSTEGAGNRRITYDAATGRWAINVGLGFGSATLADGQTYSEKGSDTFSIVEGDPLSARADSEWTIELGRGALADARRDPELGHLRCGVVPCRQQRRGVRGRRAHLLADVDEDDSPRSPLTDACVSAQPGSQRRRRRVGHCRFSIARMTSATPGSVCCSRSFWYGHGRCGAPTRAIGASRLQKPCSPTAAAISAPMPQNCTASWAITRRFVFATDSRIVSRSSG